jgi:hypothetical protein
VCGISTAPEHIHPRDDCRSQTLKNLGSKIAVEYLYNSELSFVSKLCDLSKAGTGAEAGAPSLAYIFRYLAQIILRLRAFEQLTTHNVLQVGSST